MQLRQSQRLNASIKIAIQSISGGGKSMSALLLAFGLSNNWSKIAVIDTENKSADLYSHLGNYNVITLESPYSTEKYVQAIDICEKAGMEVIIIDSISHAWEYLLDFHANLAGNSFQNWNKINPRMKEFVDKMLQSPCHIIATMRVKQDYVLNLNKDGKYVPEKVGLKSVMRDGIDFEFTILFELDIRHHAKASKDRTGIFQNRPEFIITPSLGNEIKQWCNSGISISTIKEKILNATTIADLTKIYNDYPSFYSQLSDEFSTRKNQLHNNQIKITNIKFSQHANRPNFIQK